MQKPAPNRNTFYAQTFVEALAQAGLEAVCIAPGSRFHAADTGVCHE